MIIIIIIIIIIFGLPIIKHIPKLLRPSCNAYLSTLLSKLCTTPNNISHWRAFLNFASSFLFKPRRAGKRQNLSSIIKKRFGDARAPQPSANAEVNDYVHQHRVTKARLLASLIASKMEDGDASSAIRLLHSEDKPVYDYDDIYQKLIDRHPQIPSSKIPFNDPRYTNACQVSEKDIFLALRSFPAGPSGGPDGLRPKHLLDLSNCKATGQSLLTAISSLINLLLEGKCHPDVIPVLFGGNLTALVTKSGSIRPIAVGYTW